MQYGPGAASLPDFCLSGRRFLRRVESAIGDAPTRTPAHLLFLHHPFADHLIDRRLDEPRSDFSPLRIAFSVTRHERLVSLDVGVQVLDARFASRDFDRRGFNARPLEAAFERTA